MLRLIDERPEMEAGMLPTLDEIAREGARRMLGTALEVEVAAYVEAHRQARDEKGHALVVRNGKARPRSVTLGSGTVQISGDGAWHYLNPEDAALTPATDLATGQTHDLRPRKGPVAASSRPHPATRKGLDERQTALKTHLSRGASWRDDYGSSDRVCE